MISEELKFLLKHSSIYGLGTMVSRAVAFLLLPLYTRYLTPADYGVLEVVDVSTGIIGMIVTIGISLAFSRFYYEYADDKERNRVVSTTYITYFITALVFLPILIYITDPLAKLVLKTDYYGHFFVVSFVALVVGGFVDIGMMYLRLVNKSFIFITITITQLILLITFNIIFIVYFHLGVLGILYSSLIVRLLYGVFMTGLILLKTSVRYSRKVSLDLLKFGLPIIPSSLAYSAIKQSDKYFVLYFLSMADMGIYSLALKIGNSVHDLITIPFNTVYQPRRFEIMGRSDAAKVYSKVFSYYIFVIGFIGLALSVLIPEMLKIMVTREFLRAGGIIPLVVFSMILFGCHFHFDFGILYSKKTKYSAYINVSCAIVTFGLNYILIKTYGLIGAVCSSILVLGLQAFLLYFISNKLYKIDYDFSRVVRYLFMAGIFFFLSRVIHSDVLLINLGIKISILVSFFFAIILMKILSPEESEKLKEAIAGFNCRVTNKIRAMKL